MISHITEATLTHLINDLNGAQLKIFSGHLCYDISGREIIALSIAYGEIDNTDNVIRLMSYISKNLSIILITPLFWRCNFRLTFTIDK